jgi:hypothetical protein
MHAIRLLVVDIFQDRPDDLPSCFWFPGEMFMGRQRGVFDKKHGAFLGLLGGPLMSNCCITNGSQSNPFLLPTLKY